MGYADIAEMAADVGLRRRMYGCVASLGVDNGAAWVDRWVWLLVADPTWVDAWASPPTGPATTPADGSENTAAAQGQVAQPPRLNAPPRRGWDEAVITDQMIRARIAQIWDEKGAI